LILVSAIGTVGPQAHGAKNNLLVGRYMQIGIIFYILGSLPGVLIWSFLTDETVLWFGFDEETASLAQGYAFPYLAIELFSGIDGCLHEFLDITDHEKYSTVVQILHFALQTIAVIVLATAGGTKDLMLIGTAQAYIGLMMMVANYAIVLYNGWLDDYWGGLALTLSLKVSPDRYSMLDRFQ
jgi:Na+-driven multidrug efflux pump